MSVWAPTSFENDPAREWFYGVEEAVDPGGTLASALDHALGDADYLELVPSCEAIAAAELSASCAGEAPEHLPDDVRRWAQTHPHRPHDSEIDQAVEAVARVREESELRDHWKEAGHAQESAWLRELDDLVGRLRQSGAGSPPAISP